MAEAVVGSLFAEAVVSSVLGKLGELIRQEAFTGYGVRAKIELLMNEIKKTESSLRSTDVHKKGDEMGKHWNKELRDLSYEMEDVIERFLVEVEDAIQIEGDYMNRLKRSSSIGARVEYSSLNRLKKVSRMPKKILVQEKLNKDITNMWAKIKDISESQQFYCTSNSGARDRIAGSKLPPGLELACEMVGFDVEKTNIVKQLVDPNNFRLPVVAIVGPGGIGKTTLARNIANSTEVTEQFTCSWLSLPQAKAEFYSKSEVNGKRYLIILDDVQRSDSWNEFTEGLYNFSSRNRVLMTTRFLDVANRVNEKYFLNFLSDLKSLELLEKETFYFQSSNDVTLKAKASQLAKRCGGLPLALKVVGGILSKKPQTTVVWDKVQRNLDWHSDGKECMNIVARSYEDMPYYLKSCFMYFACFPNDQEIQAKWLTRMWVAEGFIPQNLTGIPEITIGTPETAIREAPEERANSCLEELVQRCLIQVTKRYSNGKIKSCRIHGLYQELAIGEAKESNFLLIYNNETLVRDLKAARRVAFHDEVDELNRFEENKLEETLMPNVRSFFLSGVYVPIGRTLKFLKVLEFKGTKNLIDLPPELMYMIYLRYLGLRSTGVTKVPKTIGNLGSLQTLDVRDTFIESLPDTLWGIKPLRHVNVSDPLDQVDGPPPSANLENIQSLKTVRVRKAWGSRGLPRLPNVRNLGISLHRIIDEADSQPDWNLVNRLLVGLENLVSLTIRGSSIPGSVIHGIPSYQNIKSLFLCGSGSLMNLNSFEMPPNLIKLTLQQFVLDQDPMPILLKLQGLKTLRLIWLTVPREMICSAEWFLQLERFEMVFLSGLENWRVHEGAMPMLKELLIGSCFKLNVFPNLQYLTNLREFSLSNPSQKLEEALIQNPTDRVPSGYKLSHHGSAGFCLSSVS